MEQVIKLEGQSGRLDQVLSAILPDKSRSTCQKLIKDGMVSVDGVQRKANFILVGQEILRVKSAEPLSLDAFELIPQAMPLDIVYEDDDLLVINKAAGVVVHPSKGHPDHTLVNGLLHYAGSDLSTGSELFRPGIVHRIDKDTTGLLVVAKHNRSHQQLSDQLSDHTLGRTYLALVHGQVASPTGSIEVPLKRDSHHRLKWAADKAGKYALTEFEVVERFEKATLLKLVLRTGRTHQIRVHLEYIGHPIIGDPVYRQGIPAGPFSAYKAGQLLHASRLQFIHPTTEQMMHFEAPLPSVFAHFLDELRH